MSSRLVLSRGWDLTFCLEWLRHSSTGSRALFLLPIKPNNSSNRQWPTPCRCNTLPRTPPTPRARSPLLHLSRFCLLQHRINCPLGQSNTRPTFRLQPTGTLQIRTTINNLVCSTGRILFYRLPPIPLRPGAQCRKLRTTRIRTHRRRCKILCRM